jgi:hypothetical protein
MASEEEEKIIDEFMGGNGRAAEWKALRESLADRLNSLQAERASATLPDAISTLDKRIAGLAQQVAVLETEEAVSEFVETSVRSAVRAANVSDGP